MNRSLPFAAALATAAVLAAAPARAAVPDLSPAAAFTPRVPISALARPAAWFDPSRLHISTSVSVGSGFGGGTDALQVTSLSYRFAKPVWMNVSVGNAWGPSAARNGSSMFLEGLDLGVRPFSNVQIQFHYRDIRSALQYSSPYSSPFGDPYRWGE